MGGSPRRIGSFKVIRRLGGGGMGAVFLGMDRHGRRAAVKVIRSELADDPEFRRRFAREVESASRVQGESTARVLESDIEGRLPYLATEFVAGRTLDGEIKASGPFKATSLLAFALALAEALVAIHRAGVVHRDLKPSNVLVPEHGPKVIDFGIARAADYVLPG